MSLNRLNASPEPTFDVSPLHHRRRHLESLLALGVLVLGGCPMPKDGPIAVSETGVGSDSTSSTGEVDGMSSTSSTDASTTTGEMTTGVITTGEMTTTGEVTTTGMTTGSDTTGGAMCDPDDGMSCNLNGYCGLVDEVCHCQKGFGGDYCDECDVENGYDPETYPFCEMDRTPPMTPEILTGGGNEILALNQKKEVDLKIDPKDTEDVLFSLYKDGDVEIYPSQPVEIKSQEGEVITIVVNLPGCNADEYWLSILAQDKNKNKSAIAKAKIIAAC